MHLATSIEQLNAITAQINAHLKKRRKMEEAVVQDLKLTQEGQGDVLVEYDMVTPSQTRGLPFRFSVKLDGKAAR